MSASPQAPAPPGASSSSARRHRWTPASAAAAAAADANVVQFDAGHPGAGGVMTGKLVLAAGAPSSTLACVQSVPGLMTAADFCMFVQPATDALLHMRMLRPTSELNSYMVLAKFRTAADARKFADAYEGKPFLQGLIKETCRVSAVASASIHAPAAEPTASVPAAACSFPGSLLFACEGEAETLPAGAVSHEGGGAGVPCPVCLDALDASVSSLVTTVCNHTMHAACLAKWDLNSCPVCRHTHELTPEASTCMSCGHTRGLWMCVVCAYVGCGVYTNKHAQSHFKESQHPFAVILEDSTFFSGDRIKAGAVWDYVSGRFVHRLLTSEEGKVVEVSHEQERSEEAGGSAGGTAAAGLGAERPSATDTGVHLSGRKGRRVSCSGSALADSDDDEDDDRGFRAAIYASRMDAKISEYRAKVEEMEARHAAVEARLAAENLRLEQQERARNVELATLTSQLAVSREELAEKGKLLARRAGGAEKDGKELRERNAFLKNLNESLLRDKQTWSAEVRRISGLLAEKEAECREREDQLRDMYMHLEAQAKVADASSGCRANAAGPSDAAGGDILGVGPSPKERLAMRLRKK
jgi:BRCA1-associated protein